MPKPRDSPVPKATRRPTTESPDHDQRLKVLLKEFFEQFLRCFFPAWADRFDFTELTRLDKELFLAPPLGDKRHLDLVARLHVRPDAPPPEPGMTELVALVQLDVGMTAEVSDTTLARDRTLNSALMPAHASRCIGL